MAGPITAAPAIAAPGTTFPQRNQGVWLAELKPRYDAILAKHPKLDRGNHANHLGTLGTGNHFIEVCLDESETVWFMLHSGSRGVGNRMGSYFIELARRTWRGFSSILPDRDLAYFPERTEHFDDYVEAVEWAQDFARCEPRSDDGTDRGCGSRNSAEAAGVQCRTEEHQLPPQLCGTRVALRRERPGHAQRRGAGARGRYGNHPRQHGYALLYRARQRQPGELSAVAATAQGVRCRATKRSGALR